MDDHRTFRLDLSGDSALAGYYILAHWPNPDTSPDLQMGEKPMLEFDVTGSGLADLKQLLADLIRIGGPMATQAEAWVRELSARYPD